MRNLLLSTIILLFTFTFISCEKEDLKIIDDGCGCKLIEGISLMGKPYPSEITVDGIIYIYGSYDIVNECGESISYAILGSSPEWDENLEFEIGECYILILP